MAKVPFRKALPTSFDGIFFRDITQNDADKIGAKIDAMEKGLKANKDDPQTEKVRELHHLMWHDYVCDENGERFEDVTDDPSCVKNFPMSVTNALMDELGKAINPDPK